MDPVEVSLGEVMKREDFSPVELAGSVVYAGALSKQKSKGLLARGWQRRHFELVINGSSERFLRYRASDATGGMSSSSSASGVTSASA